MVHKTQIPVTPPTFFKRFPGKYEPYALFLGYANITFVSNIFKSIWMYTFVPHYHLEDRINRENSCLFSSAKTGSIFRACVTNDC